MDKKKAIKIATAASIAASAFVAAAPASTQAASAVDTKIASFKKAANAAYRTYINQAATGSLPTDVTVNYATYNAAGKAYTEAVAAVNASKLANKDAVLADLEAVRNQYVVSAGNFIDAVKLAGQLNTLEATLAAAVKDGKYEDAEKTYHEISGLLSRNTRIFNQVYGKAARDLFLEGPKATVTSELLEIKPTVTYENLLDKAESLKATDKAAAKKALEDAAVFANQLAASFKDALVKRTTTLAAEITPVAAEVTKLSVTGTKTLKVEFKDAVATEGVTFSVKRGSAVIVLDAKFAEDKKSATLSSAVALPAGDYTVTVSGGKFTTTNNTATVKVDAEKETTLNIKTDAVSKLAAGVIEFEVKNQYGELMTVSGSNVIATAYDRTAKADGTGTGTIALNGDAIKSQLTGNFTPADVANNDEILVTVSYKGLTASKVVKAQSAAALSTLSLTGAVPNTNTTRITVGETVEMKYAAVDQYGKEIKLSVYADAANDNKAEIGDYQITSSNPSVVDADSIAVDANGKMTIVAAAAGTTKLVVLNVKTGVATTADVTVVSTSAADAITLTAPSTLVAVDETVKVAYTAVNQFGETIKPIDLNTAQVALTSSNNAVATVAWVGKEIVVTGKAAGTAEITATIGTKVVKFTIDIQAKAVASKIVGVKNVSALYESTATSTLDFSKLLVKDQYGRDYTLVNGDVVTVVAKDGTANGVTFGLNDAAFDATTDAVTFTGTADKSAEVYTLAINGVAGSSYDLTLASVASTDVTTYELKAVPTLYGVAGNTAAGTHAAALTLVGKNTAGQEVALVSNKITNITTTDAAIVNVDLPTKKVFALAKGEAKVAVWNGATKLAETTVTASDVAPRLTTVTFANATVSKLTTDAAFTNAITLKDQYGIAIASTGTFSSSNTAVATVNPTTGLVTIVAAGTTTIGYVSANGVPATFTLTVQ